MLYGKEIDEIRELRKNNKFNFRLRMIEYQFAQGHISREQELDKAAKLVLDYIGKKVKTTDVLKVLDENEMNAGIDTIQITTDEEITEIRDYVRNYPTKCLSNGKWNYRLNPDKANNNIGIYRVSEYKKIFDRMIFELGLTSCELSRVDFRFDFFDNNTFDKLWKLNSVLIALISQKYNIKNRYASTDVISCERLTLRAQTQYFQIEYYHKCKQEEHGGIDTRLELRSCKMTNNTNERKEFEKWKERLLKILDKEAYKSLQEQKNNLLYERWQKETAKYKNMTKNEFLSKYIDHIYTQEQLSDFFKRLGNQAPDKAASKYKRCKGFESISIKLLTEYVNKIIASGERFFDS